MSLRIKTKIFLGLAFLFSLILLMGGVGAYYIHKVTEESNEILKDNYESVKYSREMMQLLGRIPEYKSAIAEFEKNLEMQEMNVTELGEKKLTDELRNEFRKYKSLQTVSDSAIRQYLFQLMDLNMNAIRHKNENVQKLSTNVLSSIALTGMLCLLVALNFVINFPGYVTNPLRILAKGIKQVADKNYDQHLDLGSNEEFAELAEAFNRMAKKLNEYDNSNLARIMFEKKRIETIINQMNDAIVGLDKNKSVLFANSVAEELTGLSEEEMVDRYAPDIAIGNKMMRSILDGKGEGKELRLQLKGKDLFFTKENFDVLSNEEVIGQVIILKNITSFKERDTAKTNFIATVSHELKTPIASIKMSSQLLEDKRIGNTNEEQKQLIQHIKEDADRLLKITGELLDITQAETGKIKLLMQKTDAMQIVQYAVHAIRFQAEQKKIDIDIINDQDLPLLNADKDKTAWVLLNLLSNAIRYSQEKSKIIVEVKHREKDVEFSVTDFGKGIHPQYAEKVFDRYFQVPENGTSGTGLGLAISKEFIEAQGGSIRVDSKPLEGSRFWFRLKV